MRFILLLTLFFFSSVARDNPFSDFVTQEAFPVSTNNPETLSDLKKEEIRLPNSARIVKRVIIEYQNLDGSIEQLTTELNKNVDWHMPIVVTHSKKPAKGSYFTTNLKLPFMTFLSKQKSLKLLTKDTLIRHFMIPNPHRIVLDMKGSSGVRSRRYTNFKPPFQEVRIGNHKEYYRVVIELDGQYEYSYKPRSDGMILRVK